MARYLSRLDNSGVVCLLSAILLAWTFSAQAQQPPAGPPGGIVQTIVIDPSNPSTLYCGMRKAGVFKSTNGGDTWTAASNGLTSMAVNTLVIDPVKPTTLYAATANGVFKTTNGGDNWAVANTGLTSTAVSALVIDPVNSATLYAGVPGALFKSTTGGSGWSRLKIDVIGDPSGSFDYTLAIDSSTLYAATSFFVVKSTNGGSSFSTIPLAYLPSPGNTYAFVIDPVSSATLYSSNNFGVFKSANGGSSWAESDTGIPATYVIALVIDGANHTTLYAGTNDSGVFKSTNGGGNWSAANSGLPANEFIWALAIDPSNSATLYAATSDGVFKSTNNGQTWRPTGQGGAPASGPAISQNGVVNGASFQPGIESGNYVTIKGSNFTSAAANCDPVGNPVTGCRTWAARDFSDGTAAGIAPTSLDGVKVTINNKAAFVEFVSPTQINVQAPDDVTLGTVAVQVTTPAGSATANGVLEQFSPAFLVYGNNYAVATHLDGSIVGGVTGATPAKPGELIVIYGFGFGPANPPVKAGQSPAGQNISLPAVPLATPVTITIGGSAAQQTAAYTGLAGTFIGLYQFVVTVPNVANGDQVLSASVGGVSTPGTVTINIHN
ncbi:MAG TPA: IPT/TIG domain-containing protein [Bryobacteraceae bacterium]|nr:IPT/TIG domain-containing protein [Bryobacteraceae bacterium]